MVNEGFFFWGGGREPQTLKRYIKIALLLFLIKARFQYLSEIYNLIFSRYKRYHILYKCQF